MVEPENIGSVAGVQYVVNRAGDPLRRSGSEAWSACRRALLIPSLLLVVLGACTGGPPSTTPRGPSPIEAPASEPPSSSEPSGSAQPNGLPRRIELRGGNSKERYPIEALNPPSHTYTVRLVASDTPDLKVWLTTWYGASLHVTNSTLHDPSCKQKGSQTTCVFRFPALEAQRPGIWEVHLLKRTRPPVVVTLEVTFETIG
jgi:hypothetical protein